MKKILKLSLIFFVFFIYSISSPAIKPIPKPIEESTNKLSFQDILKIVLKYEGGYFAEQKTNYGIQQGTYNRYRRSKNLKIQDVRKISLKEVEDCYYKDFYLKSGSDTLSDPLKLVHFDTSVNFGINFAKNLLKKILKKYKNLSDKQIAIKYCDLRIKYRYQIVSANKSQKKYLRGWIRRDLDLKNKIAKL